MLSLCSTVLSRRKKKKKKNISFPDEEKNILPSVWCVLWCWELPRYEWSLLYLFLVVFALKKCDLLLSIFCFNIMCFLDLIKLNNFFWQQLHKKKHHAWMIFATLIWVASHFSGRSCTEKHNFFCRPVPCILYVF